MTIIILKFTILYSKAVKTFNEVYLINRERIYLQSSVVFL
jgi:hypothetical protein